MGRNERKGTEDDQDARGALRQSTCALIAIICGVGVVFLSLLAEDSTFLGVGILCLVCGVVLMVNAED